MKIKRLLWKIYLACLPRFYPKRLNNTIYDPDRASSLRQYNSGTFLEVLTKPHGNNHPEVFWNRWFRFHMEKLLI